MKISTLPTKGERTRAHIVTTAAALFWRKSFHGVSVDEVAVTAEVNKATIYRYFADKSDLALAVVRHQGAATLDYLFASIFEAEAEPDARLAAIFNKMYSVQRGAGTQDCEIYGCPILGLALELGAELPIIRIEAEQIFERVEDYLTVIAKDAVAVGRCDGQASILARTLVQLLHGAFASARIASDPCRILDAGRASLDLLGYPETVIPFEEST